MDTTENDTTREARVGRFKSRYSLRLCRPFELKEVPVSEASEAATECLFYLEAIISLQMMIEPFRLMAFEGEALDGSNIRSLLLTLGDLCLSFSGEASRYVQVVEHAYDHVGERLDKITNIITKTHIYKGAAAEIADDQAVVMISDLLQGVISAEEEGGRRR
ncbi:MAG: hypothetical protein WCF57_09320 [Pyrinomonadaceae bacterium]